jgi:CRISPR-associated protein Cas2
VFFVVSYDIPDDKRRLRVAKTLLDFGTRVQYSVFECQLSPEDLAELVDRLKKVIRLDEDLVRIYALCAGCEREIKLFGEGRVTQDPEVYIA